MSDPSNSPQRYPPTLPSSIDPGSLQKAVARLNEIVEMITGQRGPATYSLAEGMLQLRKQVVHGERTITSSIREVNEVSEGLAQRTTIIEAELEDARNPEANLSAKLTEVDQARIDGDTALAAQIVTAEAHATGGDAVTQMRMVAEAAPAGYTAQFSMFLRVSNVNYPVGLTMRLDSGGDAYIDFTALKVRFTDPSYGGGVPGNVLTYNGTHWVFGVPIIITTGEIATDAVTSLAANSGTILGSSVGVTKTFSAGSDAVVLVSTSPPTSITPAASGNYAAAYRQFSIKLDGVQVGVQGGHDRPIRADTTVVSGVAVITTMNWAPVPTFGIHIITGLSAGSHTISVDDGGGFPIASDAVVVVLERKR